MDIEHLNSLYPDYKSPYLKGRYITNSHIERCLSEMSKSSYSVIGYSVEERPIYGIKIGEGPRRVLLWSQMHGNESTTTKALFDCFNMLSEETAEAKFIKERCTVFVIPILNPDGALYYTRANANNVDLNRDAQQLSQPESRLLRKIYEKFQPNFCFNLHGQRTIFGAGKNGNVATLSFLSPSQDENRSLTPNRKVAMALIAEISTAMEKFIPRGIGRYDDGFNLNCVGDTFQYLGTPTVLYEAGHYPKDYQREEVRRLVGLAILKGLSSIAKGFDLNKYKEYAKIPSNEKNHRDLLIKNAVISKSKKNKLYIIVQFKEILKNEKVQFIPVVESISDRLDFKFHREIDAQGGLIKTVDKKVIYAGYENDFVLINNKKIALKT